MRRRGAPRRHGRRGQALVEFALIFPILIILLIAIFDLGRLVFAYNDITNAARQGARTAIINQGGTAAVDRVIQMATSLGLKTTDVDVEYADSDGGDCHDPLTGKYTLACQVNVTVRFDWTADHPGHRQHRRPDDGYRHEHKCRSSGSTRDPIAR